ncbi:MAG TPA: DEAD/DEAH box helicase family protein [Thermovirgaceae bacterium]|nr:DEAD/DEAH box helicase family protein [Thermovirgaceae bacterium]
MKKRPDLPSTELDVLKKENARLKALLANHGIPWECGIPKETVQKTYPQGSKELTSHEKVRLFRSLFRGRSDVFAVRWESSAGRSGYSPACGNEWKRGLCGKPATKCSDCKNRDLLPLTDQVIFDHLKGKQTIGVYPLVEGDRCFFLAADFDGDEWEEDSLAFITSCRQHDIPAVMEISRSGNGAHVWIFFSEPVQAVDARYLGAALVSYTCLEKRQLSLSSYDRFFPNQDTLPKGGFGNLIALPLQKHPRDLKRTLFVDDSLTPYPDQWSFLGSVKTMTGEELRDAIIRVSGGKHPLDVGMVDEEEQTPWVRVSSPTEKITGDLPGSMDLVLGNQIYFPKKQLTQPLTNRLIRLASFQNPEFHKAQAMRLSVWTKPRIITCAENHQDHVSIPRGCLEKVLDLLGKNSIQSVIHDERGTGSEISVQFKGEIRKDQKQAVDKILEHDFGVLCAPTAFGKIISAAAVIAHRKVSTLVLVHRKELQRQWKEQLENFLKINGGTVGQIGGGKNRPGGLVDIAVMQSLSRMEDLPVFLDVYGQIIIDECHHISAFSFESILKQAGSKYILGLTATPQRRDGHQPIIFMQCGPLRHSAKRSANAPARLEVWPRILPGADIPGGTEIQEIFRTITNDRERNRRIADDALEAYREGRKILLLTERTKHIDNLKEIIGENIENCHILHGRLPGKTREEILGKLAEMDGNTPRIIIATGRLIGEGFDHPPLDTLVLAMPISWKGTLQQYAGRLHREHADKDDVRIYDYIETDNPVLAKMWEKRLKGYRAMGYSIVERPDPRLSS